MANPIFSPRLTITKQGVPLGAPQRKGVDHPEASQDMLQGRDLESQKSRRHISSRNCSERPEQLL
jgi:hypothetical protein